MSQSFFKEKVTQIFVSVDDFCLYFENPIKKLLLQDIALSTDSY